MGSTAHSLPLHARWNSFNRKTSLFARLRFAFVASDRQAFLALEFVWTTCGFGRVQSAICLGMNGVRVGERGRRHITYDETSHFGIATRARGVDGGRLLRMQAFTLGSLFYGIYWSLD